MRQNSSEMRQNGSCFVGETGTSKMRQKSVILAQEELKLKPTRLQLLPWAGLGEFAWILRIHLSFLAEACWGKPSPGVWLAPAGRGLPCAYTTISHTGFVCGGRLRQAFVCPRGSVQQWENGRK